MSMTSLGFGVGVKPGPMAPEDPVELLGPGRADVTADAVLTPCIRGGDTPDHMNLIDDRPVVLKLSRARSPDHQHRLDGYVLDTLGEKGRSHGPGTRAGTIHRRLAIAVRRPLPIRTHELGLDSAPRAD
jgi:hypothetical protein